MKTYQEGGAEFSHGEQRQEASMTTSGEIFYPCTDCGSIQKHNFAIHLPSYSVGNGSERSSLIATEQETTLS